jgi:effector-binding domain-containing protein
MKNCSAANIIIFLLLILSGCASPPEETAKEGANDSTVASAEQPVTFPSTQSDAEASGVEGVVDVPEMLSLTIMDSGPAREIAKKVPRNFLTLHKEMKRIGAVQDGPPGQINYNNDTINFKFENVVLIKSMPEIQPEKCNIVILEASKMVIYNYYGPYTGLHKAYREIADYCRKHKLVQSGPQREFYVSDPTIVRDPSKRLTRIMLPVTVQK